MSSFAAYGMWPALIHCNPDNAGKKHGQAFKDTVTLADLSQEFE